MIAPGVSHGERLEDAADRLAGFGLQEQMKMVRHEAITEELEGISGLGLCQRRQKRLAVLVIDEDIGPVIIAIRRVIDEPVIDVSRQSSHERDVSRGSRTCQTNELTLISLLSFDPGFSISR